MFLFAVMLFGLEPIDIGVIVAYFAVVVYIGWRAMKRISNQEDYFLGGRRFGRWIQTFASFGQGTSAESAVGITTMVHTNGASGIWANLASGLPLMPIIWMTSHWYRRMRLLTLADFFEERYGSKAIAGLYSLCQVVFFMIVAALGLLAMSKTIAAIAIKPVDTLTIAEKAEHQEALELDRLELADYDLLNDSEKARLDDLRLQNPSREFSSLNERVIVIAVAIFVLLYASAGGLEAAFVTDMIQGIFIILLSVILIPFAIYKINIENESSGILGMFEVMHRKLPDAFFEVWGSPLVIDFSWYWIAVMALVSIFNVGVQANQLTACGSAKDEMTARVGFTSGIFLKRYTSVIWGFVGLMTLTLYSGVVRDPDFVWGYATRDLLGPLGIGLVGLMVACLMAALMSTADALMITSSSLLTCNVYRPLFPGRSERHYLWAGRAFCACYMLGGVLIAVNSSSVFRLIKLVWTFNVILAASFWLGVLWRRANCKGAWCSMITTLLLTALLPILVPLLPGVRTSKYLNKTTEAIPVTRTYTAREMDVQQRDKAIANWKKHNAQGSADTPMPELLVAGSKFEKTITLPKKSIFWDEGLNVVDGQTRGQGMLRVELVVLEMLGWDLTLNSYSANETIGLLIKLVVPFGTLIVVSLLTYRDDKERLDRFFVKMKTPVHVDRQQDEVELRNSFEHPQRFDHLKVFPNSDWEFLRWNRVDLLGVIFSLVGIAGCMLLLLLVVSVGA